MGDCSKSLEMLEELLVLSGKDPVPIAWSISDLMRKLHYAAVLSDAGENSYSIAGKLKVWPQDRAEALVRVAGKLGRMKAAQLLKDALILDQRTKSGFGEGSRNLEIFCVKFAESIR